MVLISIASIGHERKVRKYSDLWKEKKRLLGEILFLKQALGKGYKWNNGLITMEQKNKQKTMFATLRFFIKQKKKIILGKNVC